VRAGAFTVLCVYLLVVGWLALRPLSVMWVEPHNLEPLATIRADLARGPVEGARTIGAGMLRLAPLGVLLPLLSPRLGGGRFASLVRTVSGGFLLTAALEWSQSLVPSRVADVDTIILSTCGIGVTHLLCYGRLRALLLGGPSAPPARGDETSGGAVDGAPWDSFWDTPPGSPWDTRWCLPGTDAPPGKAGMTAAAPALSSRP
jgi:hypothetical protein